MRTEGPIKGSRTQNVSFTNDLDEGLGDMGKTETDPFIQE